MQLLMQLAAVIVSFFIAFAPMPLIASTLENCKANQDIKCGNYPIFKYADLKTALDGYHDFQTSKQLAEFHCSGCGDRVKTEPVPGTLDDATNCYSFYLYANSATSYGLHVDAVFDNSTTGQETFYWCQAAYSEDVDAQCTCV